ncbi:uncharacterized protein LOC123515120 [Portunus trituberculatus]|uniref:C-type lectin domain-containing protein n=1 Tax=Portunus trituberculatus TaxID=210409 RepID=A0A5B7EH85_PORTR|nr:uncharacterized protein LOC123515120 [Portunus trituberculatus]MPC31904.1 hypothetical protein [Portunus trituberculatus]
MIRHVLAVVLLVAAAERQDSVIHDEMPRDVEGKIRVVAGQAQVMMQIESHPRGRPFVVKAASDAVQAVLITHGFHQGQHLFPFLNRPMQPEILLPSPHLPASCGPVIVSLEHDTFRGRAYHFSWCHHAGQLYTHQQSAAYCHTLAQHQPLQFEVLSLEDPEEQHFVSQILETHQIASVWTKDYSSSAPYNLDFYIDKSSSSQPGEDCLALEAGLLSRHSSALHENNCLLPKTVICEANQLM